jgi:hypothetical protein
MNEPILGKMHPRGYDYKPIVWSEFVKLRDAAQKAADKFGYPVYMVGSTLHKEIPRDIDISIIMPLDKYEEMFGKLPGKQEGYGGYLLKVHDLSFPYIKDLYFCIDYHLDIKVCPDTWWPEKDNAAGSAGKERK